MRITNFLQFTELHRFCAYRDFSLSPLDYRLISTLYQPMIGAQAASLYDALFHLIPSDQIGYSPLEAQRKLFLMMQINPNEQGRKLLASLASSLEAVGLLETARHAIEDEEMVYVYRLRQPLSPVEFFRTHHLVLLLRDKVGQHVLRSIYNALVTPVPKEVERIHLSSSENLSMPFYEWCSLQVSEQDAAWIEQHVDWQFGLEAPDTNHRSQLELKYKYEDIIARFPRQSINRGYVENLKYEPEQLEMINYVAAKFDLSLSALCRVLDEDGVFNMKGELSFDVLQRIASDTYRQEIKREADRNRYLARVQNNDSQSALQPAAEVDVDERFFVEVPELLKDRFEQRNYNLFLRNEPYTKVLRCFFPGTVPTHVLNIFEQLDINYKLPEEVINVLIHFLHTRQLSWTKRYIDSIASDLLGKRITVYEKAVDYFRNQQPGQKIRKNGKVANGFDKPSARKKPQIKIASTTSTDSKEPTLTAEELLEIQKIVKELDGS